MINPQLAPEETGSPWAFGMRHRLALALEISGTSVQEMAVELGVSANTVGNYTSGRTTPKHATLRIWAMRTGAPLEWILTGVDPTSENGPHAHHAHEGHTEPPAGLEPATCGLQGRPLATVTPIRSAA